MSSILGSRWRRARSRRWRFVHAAWDILQPLAWYREDDPSKPTDEVSFHEIALDGLATGDICRQNPLVISMGQRVNAMVKAPMLAPGQERCYFLMRQQLRDPLGTAPATGALPKPVIVAHLVVRGNARPMALPKKEDLQKCVPFAPIADGELVTATIPGPDGKLTTDTLTFLATDPDSPPDPAGANYVINGKTFHQQQAPIPLKLGTAQEWKLVSDFHSNSGHPFHIHVNAFQVVGYQKAVPTADNPTPVQWDYPDRIGIWRDTLFIPPGATYTIRARYQDISGKSVLHCHILDHEDQGMMMSIELVNPNVIGPPATGAGAAKVAALTPVSQPAPALRLAEPGGKIHDLAEYRGRPVVLVFFKGIQCRHCAIDLAALIKEARMQLGSEAEILAVSARKIADPARALALLGVEKTDRFRLLVDEARAAFQSYGCLSDDDPQHGLFLIDRSGVIRSRYTGETPFGDSREVFARLRRLAVTVSRPTR